MPVAEAHLLHTILLIVGGIFGYIFICILHFQFITKVLKWDENSEGTVFGTLFWPLFTTFWFVAGFFYCPVVGVICLFKRGGRLLSRRTIIEEVK